MIEFRLPDLGEGITEGELVRWLVKPGDQVTLDQAIAEVQTDKAVVELPAPAAGTITQLNVAEGQVVPVDTLLLTIDDGENAGASMIAAKEPVAEEISAAAREVEPAAPVSHHEQAAPVRPANEAKASTVPARPTEARASGQLTGAPNRPQSASFAIRPQSEAPDGRWTEASVAPQRRALATPAVRRLARELGLDITIIEGSGPARRVLAEDLRAATAAAEPTISPTGARTIVAEEMRELSVEETQKAFLEEMGPSEERLPLRGLRRRIAENMVLSTSTIPQVTSLVEVDAAGLVALRRSVLPAAEAQGVKLSYLPFIVKALVQALRQYPYINAAIDDASKEIILKRHYHIGIATATPDGLLVPVLRHADRLTIVQIAAALNRLAEAGRARKLALEELRGSTFTISNYGAVGGYFATPIINPGEAAILGLGRIAERPWVVEGRVEPRPILPLSFTADHRLIDGELAMRFLNTLITTLENPGAMLLEMR